jgi:HSP20 family molecular chaperone IbpA
MRERVRVPECTGIHQLEIDFGTFRRAFHFPSNLDGDGAESSYRHGFLEIILPKLSPRAAFQVPLKRG